MPEGDTVYKLAAYLRDALSGRVLGAGSMMNPGGEPLDGLRVGDVFAHGKHLFIAIGDTHVLRSHLGMHGSWHAYAPGQAWQRPVSRASVLLYTPERVYVCFNARQVEWLRRGGVRRRVLAQQLGPDLLDPAPAFDAIVARARRLAGAATPVADLLLDQRIATGIGNVYKSETLFLRGVDPRTPAATLADGSLRGLFETAAGLLHDNVGGGPRVTRRAHDQAGVLWVYGRARQPCLRCADRVRCARLGRHWRSTYWCPTCQPAA